VLFRQTKPVWQVPSGQQLWSGWPQPAGSQVPLTQARFSWQVLFAQQGWPLPPQATAQVPFWHVLPVWQVSFAQQTWPVAPHGRQKAPRQIAVGSEQMVWLPLASWQQGWFAAPHGWQVSFQQPRVAPWHSGMTPQQT
jgi:hypothetical protein